MGIFKTNETFELSKAASVETKTLISFRGTVIFDTMNMRRNFLFKFAPTTMCPGCESHQGFWRNFLSLRPMLAVDVAQADLPVFTEMSMGAPLAVLAASMSLTVFNQPMKGC